MKRIAIFLLSLTAVACGGNGRVAPEADRALVLHYDRPAAYFEEALPIGNGRLGAMVYGNPGEDVFTLNDITLWTGEPDRGLEHPDVIGREYAGAVDAVRAALEAENYPLAEQLQHRLQGHFSETYQPLGTLRIRYDDSLACVTEYRRELNLADATVRESYLRDGEPFTMEAFASAPDSVIVIRLSYAPGIHARISFDSPQSGFLNATDATLCYDGYAAWHAYPGYYRSGEGQFLYDPDRGIHFRTMVHAQQRYDIAGTYRDGDGLVVDGNPEITIYIVNSTSFNGYDKDPVREEKPFYAFEAAQRLKRVYFDDYPTLRQRHTADYRKLFNRVSIDLGATPDSLRALPTDQQLQRYTDLGEANPELEALYYQYGRYLLIASSRTPAVPANLQGLWNERMDPPWSSNYTTNINLEENYWPAETANLGELHEPLLGFIRALSVTGQAAARDIYGVRRGWCVGQNSDIWAAAQPVGLGVGDPCWANWTMGGAWLATHLWEHWLFSRDREALERDYPALRGAAEFCLDWLVEKDGELVTMPGTSPENRYRTPEGFLGATLYGATADLAIVREVLTDAVAAARELGVDASFVAEASSALARLRCYHIAADGSLMEWYRPDFTDPEPQHRHQSHLFGVYPGHQIAVGDSLASAALKTLEIKGFETTGWSCGWRINLYARLGEAELAYRMYRRLLRYVSPDGYTGPDARRGGGTYPNLLDAHAPFQIDGNFGGCAGVMEMLLQSTPDGRVTPLPALPAAWPSGHIHGLRTRAGTTVDLDWSDGVLTSFREY